MKYKEVIGAVIVFVWAGSYLDALVNPSAIPAAASITPVMLAFVGWLFWKQANGDGDEHEGE